MNRTNIAKIVLALAAASIISGCTPIINNIRNVIESPKNKYQRPYYEELGTQAWRTEQQKKNWYYQPSPYASRKK